MLIETMIMRAAEFSALRSEARSRPYVVYVAFYIKVPVHYLKLVKRLALPSAATEDSGSLCMYRTGGGNEGIKVAAYTHNP
jgi:hypothetical protein